MCGCNEAAEYRLKSKYFGYQVEPSGALSAYSRVGSIIGLANYTPPNPLHFNPEMGFNGYSYGLDVRAVAPIYGRERYGGILPLDKMPRVEVPQPYDRRVVN